MELSSTHFNLNLPHKPISLDMGLVYKAEKRLQEVAIVTPDTANELSSFFNEACNFTSRHIGQLEFELLHCKKEFSVAKARIILDVMPLEVARLKELGMKPNDDWREALVVRDSTCANWQGAIDLLNTAKALLVTKLKSFERAYYSCYKEKDRKMFLPTTKINGYIGETNHVDLTAQQIDADIRAYYGGNNG